MRNLIEAVVTYGQCEVHTPPDPVMTDKPTIFLAGTIDMGVSEDWQTMVGEALSEHSVCLLNPRRASWDKSWKQDISEPNFRGQVQWEMDYQDEADLIVIYFASDSKSPITLLELGMATRYPEKVMVACEEDFWRRGNVQMVCERFDIPLFDTLDELIDNTKDFLINRKGG
jgi:hypothetical protein